MVNFTEHRENGHDGRQNREEMKMADRRKKRKYQSKRGGQLRKRKIGQWILLILMALALVLLMICIYIFWREGTRNKPEEVPEQAVEQEEQILELNGEKEITYMAGSVYQEQGTSQKDAVISGEPDLEKAGTYTIEYTWNDQTVSRTVHVVDDGQMIMTLQGSEDTFVKQNQPYVESGCWALDQTSGNLTGQVETSGEVDTSVPGEYEVIYSVQNAEGIQCSRKRTVHVLDEASFRKNTTGIPVLMYHYVYTEDDKPDELNTNYLLNTKLEEQLKYLKEENYYFPSYQELSAYVKGEIDLPEKSIVLTFDDGQKGFLNYGIPLLEKYKIPATSFVIASKDWDTKLKDYASEYVSFQSHSYDMHKGGGTIGHGGIISAMSREEILQDLKTAQNILSHTEAFAYPYGDVTEDAKTAVEEAGILCAFTTEHGRAESGGDPAALPRVRVLGDALLEGFIASVS